MKVYVEENWNDGREFTFTENLSEYDENDPYIVNIDDKKIARWKKILLEKEKIDRRFWAIQHILYDIKVGIDNELVEVVCPGCKQVIVFERDYVKGGMFDCYYCDCLVGYNWDESRYYVHSGKGVASIDRTFWKSNEGKARDKAKRKEFLIKRERQARKQGILKKK